MLWNAKHTIAKPIVLEGETIPAMFANAVRERGNQIALREKDFGIWKAVTWNELGQIAKEIGLGLVALGFEPGERISILANTVKEWMFTDLAALGAAGVVNGIYPTDSSAQCEYLINDSQSVYVFVEDEEQLDKILDIRVRIPQLRKIIVFDMEGLLRFSDPQVIGLDALRELGRHYARQHPDEWERRIKIRKPDDLAILVYTSGTTGKPKGAMISHHNLVHVTRGYNTVIPQDERDERICFLPLCHIAERVGGEYCALYTGAILNFVENPDTVPENVREISPTIMLAVPRVWEKFYSAVTIAISESTKLQQFAYKWAIGIGQQVAQLFIDGKPIPALLKIKFHIGRRIALDNIRKMMGIHRSRILATGAAPISLDLIKWYLALGVPMLEVWGQTESSGAASAMTIDRIRPGSIGPACPYNEMKISPEGEILVRGENVFMGYLNQPERTAETIEDGWLHTGDVGSVDADGFFKITDRMKDIIITAGGKNITPSELENQLKFSPYITDTVVIGDKRAYLTALIMIDQDNVEKFAQDNDVPFSNYASLTRAKAVQELIGSEVERVNKQFARVEQIKTFRLIEQQLTAEDEELTPTMKLKRKFVHQKYAELIESMYRSA